LGITSPYAVYLLINSGWGAPDVLVATVTFRSIGGDEYSVDIVEGYNLRDWVEGGHVNTYTSPDMTTVFNGTANWGVPARIDMLTVEMPDEIRTSVLDEIIIDAYETGYQEGVLILQGISVEGAGVIPEPGTLSLFTIALGGAGLSILRRKR